MLARAEPANKFRGGDFSDIWQSSPITGSLDEVYLTALLWQNNGRQNGLISRRLFCELFKIMVKNVTFVGFKGGDRPNCPPWMLVLIKFAYCNIHTTINTEKARGP